MIGALRFEASTLVPAGKVVLMRGDRPVWIGDLSALWDDVECDRVLMSLKDFAKIEAGLAQISEAQP